MKIIQISNVVQDFSKNKYISNFKIIHQGFQFLKKNWDFDFTKKKLLLGHQFVHPEPGHRRRAVPHRHPVPDDYRRPGRLAVRQRHV